MEMLTKLLDNKKNIKWKENKGLRFRLSRQDLFPKKSDGNLWVRITPSRSTYVVTTNGQVTSHLAAFISEIEGNPTKISENSIHKDWIDVEFSDVKKIVDYFMFDERIV